METSARAAAPHARIVEALRRSFLVFSSKESMFSPVRSTHGDMRYTRLRGEGSLSEGTEGCGWRMWERS